jgi:endonuclease/exonuclease/phosphatase family metal-dependent hydrolase
VSLVSWNTHGLPFTGAPARLERLIKKVEAYHPDFVILQEVWFRRYAARFTRAFPSYDATEYRSIAPMRTGGLLVLTDRSRGWRVTASEFVEFRDAAPFWRVSEMDGLSGKGFLVVHIRNGDGTMLRLIVTHLQSQYDRRAYARIRSNQLTQLNDYVRTHPGPPIILAGDFNTAPCCDDAVLYNTFVDGIWKDLTAGERAECLAEPPPAKPCGTHYNGDELLDDWIDYVFVTGPLDGRAWLIPNTMPHEFSDHEGVQATITVKAAAGAPAATH